MTQQMKAEVVIEIPEDYVLVEKVAIEELKQQAEPEWVTGLDWLSKQTGIASPQILKERILYPFEDELIEFVDYPENQGGKWRFNTYAMKYWLRTNFARVKK